MRMILIFLFSFFLSITATANSSANMETLKKEYEALKVKVDAKLEELAELEKRCTNPQDTCALELEDIKATLKDLKKKLTEKAKVLGVDNPLEEEPPKEPPKSPEEKARESALKKTKRQQKLLKLASVVSGGVGVYLLAKKCKPAAGETMGCYLGPLALAQSLVSYKRAKELGKTADQMSAIETPPESGSKSPPSEEEKTPPEEPDTPVVEGTPVEEIPFPCPGNSKQSCTLSPDGTKIRPLNGGPPIDVGALAGVVPEDKKTNQAIDEALKAQEKLLAEARQLDPDFDPFAGQNLSGGAPLMGGSSSSPGGSGSGSPLSAGGAGGEEEIEWVDEETPPSGNALHEQFVGNAASADSGGDFSEGDYDGDEEGDLNVDAEVQKLLNKYGKKSKMAVKAKKPLSFGKNDKISRASENIFSVIQKRYQYLRRRGEFIEGSSRRSVNKRSQERRR